MSEACLRAAAGLGGSFEVLVGSLPAPGSWWPLLPAAPGAGRRSAGRPPREPYNPFVVGPDGGKPRRPGAVRRVWLLDSDTDACDDLERSSDNDLIEAARRAPAARAERCLAVLYRRHYRRVAYWCLKISGNREEAADLAQEVFLRVHARLDSFRMESAFSTWLYMVTRSVAINRGKAAQRQPLKVAIEPDGVDPVDPSPDAAETLGHNETLDRVRLVMQTKLEPLEAKVLYLHHADGMTLPAITRLLALDNKSGAKAYIVSGIRKLKRHLGGNAGRNASPSER